MIARFLNSYDLPLFRQWVFLFTDFDVSQLEDGVRVALCESDGDLIAFVPVDFMPAQGIALISSFWVKPETSREDAQLAGNAIDEKIARECALQGIRSFLIVVPQWQESPFERAVSLLHHQISYPPIQAASYLN